MKCQFNVGDWVKIKEKERDRVHHVTFEKKYQIIRIDGINDDDYATIVFIDDRGRECGGWYDWRFELAAPPFDATWTYKKLYVEAQKREIPRRSALNKLQLIDALNGVKKEVPKPVPPKLSLGMELKEKVNGKHYTASYAFEFSDGSRRFHYADVCHARMNFGGYYGGGPEVSHVALCIEGHYNHADNKETYRKFVEYILNDSPWASCFLTKKWEDAIGEVIYINVDEAHSRCVCAAIALRMGSEYPDRLKVFQYFLDMGYDANTAWLGANLLQRQGKIWSHAPLTGGHDVFVAYHVWEDVAKFFKSGWHVEDKVIFRTAKDHGYSIFSSIGKYGHNIVNGTMKQFAINNCKNEVVGNGWDAKESITYNSIKNFMDIVAKAIAKE
jgi:hypothetical protein